MCSFVKDLYKGSPLFGKAQLAQPEGVMDRRNAPIPVMGASIGSAAEAWQRKGDMLRAGHEEALARAGLRGIYPVSLYPRSLLA